MTNPITVKVPKALLRPPTLQKDLLSVLKKSADEAEKLFKSSVHTFSPAPQVHKKITQDADSNTAQIWIDDENYARLNNGTSDHIVGAGGRLMVFQGFEVHGTVRGQKKYGFKGADRPVTYWPKTAVGRIAAKAGYAAPGTETIFRRGPWKVKGIEPRRFDEQIRDMVAPDFIKNTNKAVKKALKG